MKVTISTTLNLNGDAEFNSITIDLESVNAYMETQLENKVFTGIADMVALRNTMTTAEQDAVLKYFKMMTAEAFNDAMGTSYTWDQVPTSIFTRA